MVPPTRRHLLQAATAVAAGLAGCSGLAGDESSSGRSVSEGGTTLPKGASESDPDVLLVRADTDRPPLRVVDRDAEQTEPEPRDRQRRRIRSDLIDSASRAERLVVADGVDGGSVTSFVSETEFGSETLYLESKLVEECFRLELCSISWRSDEVQTDYVRLLRPYDESCSAGERGYESRLIRIPGAIDRDEVNSFGSSVGGSGGCDGRRAVGADGSGGGGESADTPTPASDRGDE